MKAVALSLIAATGCGQPVAAVESDAPVDLGPNQNRPTLLAELADPTMFITYGLEGWTDHDPLEGRHITVDFRYSTTPVIEGDVAFCPTLHASFHADASGAPLAVAFPGGWRALVLNDLQCDQPTLRDMIPIDTIPTDGRVTLADESLELVAQLGDLLVPRTLVGVPNRAFAAGEAVTFRWSRKSDLDSHVVGEVTAFLDGAASTPAIEVRAADARTGDVTIVLPTATVGSQLLLVVVRQRRSCGPSCTIEMTQLASQPITMQ